MARRRHLSRIAVMQALFERETRPTIDPVASLAMNSSELGSLDEDFAKELLNGVVESQEELKDAIQKHAPDWSMDRMDPIARCVLYIGSFELLKRNDVPPAVVMNEAIEIAKSFGTDESGKFVNGVLNALAKHLESTKNE